MLTLPSALVRARRVLGARVAVKDAAREFTWHEHVERVARAAGALRDAGLDIGQRIGILSRNSREQCELLHAGYWSGVIPVPVNVRLAPREIAFVLADAGCARLAVDPALATLLGRAELAPWRDGAIALGPGEAGWDARVEAARPLPARDAAEDEDAILLYTGGTTGQGKGVRLTHRNIVANGLQVGLALSIRDDDTYLHVAPMFHSADLLATAVTLAGGAHAYLPEFNASAYLGAIERYRATFSMLAPTMLIVVLSHPEFDRHDLGSLRIQVYGSAPMAEAWIRRAIEQLPGVQVTQGYGLTETAPILSFLSHRDHVEAIARGDTARLASAGRALAGVDLRVVDHSGTEVPAGTAGEVIVRGPNVTPGYLGLGEVNAQTFRAGWFHTGDVGQVDADGYLTLLDRKKDMIVTGGENVYSAEVEAALVSHPAVADAAVIGVPDAVYGEAVFAVLVMKPGSAADDADLIAHCRTQIGGFKIPRRFARVEALPRSALGKVLKGELRARFTA